MSKLILASTERNGVRVSNVRLQPLVTWLHFLNFVTIAILCLLLLKIYKTLLLLYEWFFPFKRVSERPIILVLGPKNKIIQEIIYQLSQTFNSEVIVCQDLNDNSSLELKPKKNLQKSQIICSHEPIGSQEVISELRTHVQKAFGFVDILVISQNEDPPERNSTQSFLSHLNKQLLVQFWTVMAFLPGMLRRNRGHILSVALGRSSLTNTDHVSWKEKNRESELTSLAKTEFSPASHAWKNAECWLDLNALLAKIIKRIMRTIHEELLQCNTNVKLTLVESNTVLDNHYLPSLSSDVMASLIVRSMWNSSSVVKVPSVPCYLIMLPVVLIRFLLRPVGKIINLASIRNP